MFVPAGATGRYQVNDTHLNKSLKDYARKNFFSRIEFLTFIPSDLLSKTYVLIHRVSPRDPSHPRLSTSRNPDPLFIYCESPPVN
jgi:hypothetical protein